jgi:hypothetical protein
MARGVPHWQYAGASAKMGSPVRSKGGDFK